MQQSLKRRRLIRQIGLGAAATAALTACSSQEQFFGSDVQQASQPRVEWRMATSWLETLDILFDSAQLMCDRVRELTGGNFLITAFPAGGVAPPAEILDTVQTGNVECGHTTSSFYISKNPALAFATTVPFGLNPTQQMAWLYGGGGLDLMREVYADFNIIHFPAGSTGHQMGGWYKKKVQSIADLKDLKMRMPGLGIEVMKRLGVKAQNMPAAEILAALERNDIDAADWIGPYDDEKLGLNKAAQFYYYPGWHEPGATLDLLVNKAAWSQLPSQYQQALQTAAFEAHVMMLSRYESANREALERILASGVELVPYSNEILTAAQKAASEIYGEFASQNASFRKVYEQWSRFRKGIYQWNRVNEESLAKFIYVRS